MKSRKLSKEEIEKVKKIQDMLLDKVDKVGI